MHDCVGMAGFVIFCWGDRSFIQPTLVRARVPNPVKVDDVPTLDDTGRDTYAWPDLAYVHVARSRLIPGRTRVSTPLERNSVHV